MYQELCGAVESFSLVVSTIGKDLKWLNTEFSPQLPCQVVYKHL